MTPETERLLQQELRFRKRLRMPGAALAFLALVMMGLIFAAALYRVVAWLLGAE